MAKNEFGIELEKKLSLLSQTFFWELKRIVEQRQKLEKETISAIGSDLIAANKLVKKASTLKNFTVRLESSLGEKLAKSRGTADDLEEKLQEMTMTFEDKAKTIERMKRELDRRERILVQSVQEIEVYVRVLLYLKQEADEMHGQLRKASVEQNAELNRLKNDFEATKTKKNFISKAIDAFRPPKLFLEKMLSELSSFSCIRELVDYVLVLETLQEELLDRETECREQQECLTRERQSLREYERRIPAIVMSKESKILDLKSELKSFKYETAQLEEQIDLAFVAKIKEDAQWYDIQRWIKKLHLKSIEVMRPTRVAEEPTDASSLYRLDQIKDFVRDAFWIQDRLKANQ